MDSELEKAVTFFRFEDLRIYHKAIDYIEWVTIKTSQFPNDNQASIGGRFGLSAQAIALNISEGSARNKSQFIYYLKMAKSAVRECVVFTLLASKLGYINETEVEESRGQLMEMTKMIGALIGSLQRASDLNAEDPD
ncbi:MAG: four helix bundle protein [Lentimicrobiaceae bacterium]|nr:four helix bundle protein [Lentimicrobiaceae bacterium]MCB9023271.1 four helix bundle protein [Lentimicrobiaceae bacterium]